MKTNESSKPIVVEQIFNFPVSIVWEAITNLDHMKSWFFNNIPAFKPVVGFQTKFMVQSGDRNFTHFWKIIEVIPYRRIKYRWSYEEYEGEGFVTFDLSEKGSKTILRLTNEGLETFPKNIPEFKRESCKAGWDFFIRKNLKDFLERKNP